MAKITKDLLIDNTSYTNKDFTQIYPELLDLTKNLTNKWNPETTNESDPGLVLLKLLAFIGDKNNYNIDKNILEQFMPSVTQETSMRNLCDMMGYNVKYYRSSTCQVSFTYIGGISALDTELGIDEDGNITGTSGTFRLKAFDTSFKTEDNIVYTLLEDMIITTNERTDVKQAIQGSIKALNITDSATSTSSTKIQLYNLDENNRVYIPDTMVAENGIFINKEVYSEGDNPDAWRRVDNLNDQELGAKVFKFGYDSKRQLPYIEFPSDIADLIGDGLEIYYIVSDGENGSITNGVLTAFNTYSFVNSIGNEIAVSDGMDETSYSITNANSIGGRNPETIDEAYNNFKRTVGTFNTLVSCKDYSNAICTYQDTLTDYYVVSNVQATDIRTDPNRSVRALIRDKTGMTFYNSIIKVAENGNLPIGTSYTDLILHGSRPYNSELNTRTRYNQTYSKLEQSDLVDIGDAIEEYKTISHTLTLPLNDEIAFIENRYTLKVNVSTKYKVNSTEESDILNNIYLALYNNFNARKVEFGEEIPYDLILEVIQNADERIKNVVVDDPIITPYVVLGSGSIHKYNPIPDGENNNDLGLIVDNILGGRIQLYIENDKYSFDYTMNLEKLNELKHIQYIQSSFNFPVTEGKKLQKNETIQIVEDSYIAEVTYPAFVYYYFDSTSEIKDGVPYTLKENEILYIYYTNSEDVIVVEEYKENTIIRANGLNIVKEPNTASNADNLSPSRWLNVETKEVFDTPQEGDNIVGLYALGTNETIEKLKQNKVDLKSANQRCYWYIKPHIHDAQVQNEESNLILVREDTTSNKFFHILEEGEVFVYPSEDMLSLNTIGSGTKLEVTLPTIPENSGNISNSNFVYVKNGESNNIVGQDYLILSRTNISDENRVINIEELQDTLNTESISSFESSFKWNIVRLNSVSLSIIEQVMYSFVEGEEVKYSTSGSSQPLTRDWKTLLDGDTINTYVASSVTSPKARTVLSVNGNATTPQEVLAGQTITICYATKGVVDDIIDESESANYEYYSVDIDGNSEQPPIIQVFPIIDSYGDIILKQPYYVEDGVEYKVEPNKYILSYSVIKYSMYNNSDNSFYNLIQNLQRTPSADREEYDFTAEELLTYLGDGKTSENGFDGNHKIVIKIAKDLGIQINVFDTYTAKTRLCPQKSLTEGEGNTKTESYPITIDLSEVYKAPREQYKSIHIKITIPKILEINPLLNALDSHIDTIKGLIKTTSKEQFDYLAEISNSKLINSYDVLYSFFDYNNVYNSLTIPKIYFASTNDDLNTEIKVVASSRR